MYKSTEVQKRYRWKQFQEIPQSKLWEFIGPITTSQKDIAILATWEQHFKSVKVPYVVIKRLFSDFKGLRVMAKFIVCERRA